MYTIPCGFAMCVLESTVDLIYLTVSFYTLFSFL